MTRTSETGKAEMMVEEERPTVRKCAVALATFVLVLSCATLASAGGHTWDVNEMFSNANGTIQFVELLEQNGTPNENNIVGSTLSSNAESFTIGGAAPSPTSNKHYLIATAAFAALPGAPTPDYIIPEGSIPFVETTGDTVTYGPYDSVTFGSGVLPTDGIDSLNDDLTTGVNSPTNYLAESGSVDASPPATPIPSFSVPSAVAMVSLLFVGLALANRRSK
jgi:hypothetical protein